jgi:WD40 repeat protein
MFQFFLRPLIVCSVSVTLGSSGFGQTPAANARLPDRAEATEPLPAGALARLGNGSNPFLVLAFSPDGKLLASAGYEKIIQVWEPLSGKEIRRWTCPAGSVNSLAFSPNGALLASASVTEGTIELWDPATGHEVRKLSGLPRGVSSLSFSPDGKLLASGGYHTEQVYVWQPGTGKLAAQLSGPDVSMPENEGRPGAPLEYSYVTFSPDGKCLASGHAQGLIRIWDTASLKEIKHFRGRVSDLFIHLTYSPDGDFLTSWGEMIRVWRVRDWKQTRFFGDQPDMRVATLAISPDSRMVVSGSSGRDIGDDHAHVWELITGYERCQLGGHRFAISAAAFSPDGSLLVTGSRDGTALVWDIKGREHKDESTATYLTEPTDQRFRELGDRGPRAYQTIRQLAQNSQRTIPFLKARLHPVMRLDEHRLAYLVEALDSSSFFERQAASDELAMQVELAEPFLRRALKERTSPEAHRRIEQVLQLSEQCIFSFRQLQMLRSIELLEDIGTPAAAEILATLVQGTAEFRITREAKSSLERLQKRLASR